MSPLSPQSGTPPSLVLQALSQVGHSIQQACTGNCQQTLSQLRQSVEQGCTGNCLRNWKLIFTAIIIVEGIIFSHLIFLLRRFCKSPSAIRKINLFSHAASAGVFLATGFLHILPEAISLIAGDHDDHDDKAEDEHEGEEHEGDGHEGDGHAPKFPWAFAIMMGSFYLLFFLEKIAMPALFPNKASADLQQDELTSDSKSSSMPQDGVIAVDTPQQNHDTVESDSGEAGSRLSGRYHKVGSVEFWVAILHVVGISAHSFFEAAALALSPSITPAANIFAAVASHRWATALAISVLFAGRLSKASFIIGVSVFSAFIAVGVGIGFGLGNMSQMVRGIMFAISAGTFLYVGVIEGMGAAFDGSGRRLRLQLFGTMLLGSAAIVTVTAILVAAKVSH